MDHVYTYILFVYRYVESTLPSGFNGNFNDIKVYILALL